METKISYFSRSDISIDQVITLADEHKKFLGMLPHQAFEEAASEDRVVVAVRGGDLIGYLLFGFSGRTKYLRITHLCVDKRYRKFGVAEQLFSFLRDGFPGYRAIKLHCRRDYGLQGLWSSLGMSCKGEIPGRSKDRRPLEVWAYFKPGVSVQDELDLFGRSLQPVVLDSNIVYDLIDPNCETDSRVLTGDWLKDEYCLCVSPEVTKEVTRSTDDLRRSKNLAFINSNFLDLEYDVLFFKKASKFLRAKYNPHTENEQSDLNHVAYALASKSNFLISRDEWLRKVGLFAFDGRSVKVVRPSEFAILEHSGVNIEAERFSENVCLKISWSLLEVGDIDRVKHAYKAVDEKANQIREKVHSLLARQGSRSGVLWDDDRDVALFAGFPDAESLRVPLIRVRSGSLEREYLQYALNVLVTEAVRLGVSSLVISDVHSISAHGKVLGDFGFLCCNGSAQKFVAACPEKISSDLSPFEKEKFLWPSKNMGDGLGNYIFPIEPQWAKELFDTGYAAGDFFGARKGLHLRAENVYYRSPQGPRIEPGSRLLWYVSGRKRYFESASVRAASLIQDVEIGSPAYLFKKFKKLGVFNFSQVEGCADKSGDVMAVRFSHTESFSRPVPLGKVQDILQSFGKGRFNFASPLCIEEEIFMAIYECAKEAEK